MADNEIERRLQVLEDQLSEERALVRPLRPRGSFEGWHAPAWLV